MTNVEILNRWDVHGQFLTDSYARDRILEAIEAGRREGHKDALTAIDQHPHCTNALRAQIQSLMEPNR